MTEQETPKDKRILNDWSLEPKSFAGVLSLDEQSLAVRFTAGVDRTGALVLDVERFPLDARSAFISRRDAVDGTKFVKFKLTGLTNDGTEFACEDLAITGWETNSVADGPTTAKPRVGYSTAHITLAVEQSEFPVVIWYLRGYEGHWALNATSPLGDIELVKLAGSDDSNENDNLSGRLAVRARHLPDNPEDWRTKVEELCNHIRHVMSFAAGKWMPAPLHESRYGGISTVEAYSQSTKTSGSFPVFHPLSLDEIFQCAVRYHFTRPFDAKHLDFAIQWFCMRGSYREANLITAMTVLENLIDSNLTDKDKLILPEKKFKILRDALSNEIKSQAKSWADDPSEQQAYIDDLCTRLTDLKRRSLLDKMVLLARRWGVDLDGIADEDIRGAKRARDQIVHQGHYKRKPDSTKDLHDYLLTIREVVTRFILTALAFEGRYESYLGGSHTRMAKLKPRDPGCAAGAPALPSAPITETGS